MAFEQSILIINTLTLIHFFFQYFIFNRAPLPSAPSFEECIGEPGDGKQQKKLESNKDFFCAKYDL